MFGKKEVKLSESQIEKLNSLLVDELKKEVWTTKDFDNYSIYHKVEALKTDVKKLLESAESELPRFAEYTKTFEDSIIEIKANKIIIFNTELYEAKPIGMVDIGRVKKFGTASTGNRFENGVIGYAIEQASDNAWASNNSQENDLNEVKSELLIKAKTLYPDCNMIFKFESDFRELGSSGNVFIYLKGTAAVGNNKEMYKAINEEKELLAKREMLKKRIEAKIEKIQKKYQFIIENYKKIPSNPSDIEKMLGV
jgi:hypothetical protein